VVWNGERHPRRVSGMAEPEMAPSLPHDFIAEPLERAHRSLSRDDRKRTAHRAITTTLAISTPEGSGIGSPLPRMSSRQSSIASLMLAMASWTVSPWL
jgi:hypothetical protein